MKASDYLSRDEIRNFTRRSDFRGFLAVVTTWTMIGGSFALVAFYPGVLTVITALIIMGGRQLALAILTHDCSHYSLFESLRLNDTVGRWLCGNPVWLDLKRYRAHHMLHHRYAGSEKDPDRDLVAGYPTSRMSMLRKLLRDLTGITGLKRISGLILMDLGFMGFTVSSRMERIDQKGRPFSDVLKTGARNLSGVLLTNGVLFLILHSLGLPELYLLWIIAYLTTYSLILRIRSIAEHAGTEMDRNPLKSTRTTYASPMARVTVAPHRVNYHLDHHVLMAVPYFKLPSLHQTLKDRGAYEDAYLSSGYLQVLREATAQAVNAEKEPKSAG